MSDQTDDLEPKQRNGEQRATHWSEGKVKIGWIAWILVAGVVVSTLGDWSVIWAQADGGQARRVIKECYRIGLERDPEYVFSAAWDQSGKGLFIIDSLGRRLLGFNSRGRSNDLLPPPTQELIDDSGPTGVARLGDSLIVRVGATGFIEINDRYRARRSMNLVNDAVREDGWGLKSAFNWAPTRDALLVFGDRQYKDSETLWRSGFFLVPWDAPEQFVELGPGYSLEDASIRNFYLLANQYIAGTDSEAYVVEMSAVPAISRVEPNGVLRALDLNMDRLPSMKTLPDVSSRPGAEGLLQAVEDAKRVDFPVGLFGWKDDLFLLSRQRGPRWTVTRIDPIREEVVGTGLIRSSAEQLVVAPGAEAWAFIEKGAIEGIGRQKVESVLLIPSEQIEGITGELDLCGG